MKPGENLPLLPLKLCPWSIPGGSGRRNRPKVSMSCVFPGCAGSCCPGGRWGWSQPGASGGFSPAQGPPLPSSGWERASLGYDGAPGLGLGRACPGLHFWEGVTLSPVHLSTGWAGLGPEQAVPQP